MTTKLLTGQMIHEAIQQYSPMMDWTDLPIKVQENYNQMAKTLNQQLGICEECGERPADGILHEVAGDMNCIDCCTPPVDTTDPNAQYMHLISNPDGTLAGIVTPPTGMSLKAYEKLLQVQMAHICFVLDLPEIHERMPSWSIKELHETIKHYAVPAITPNGSPKYSIRILNGEQEIGIGHYELHAWHVEILKEEGAAQGLRDALYAYAFNHKA